VQQLGDLFGRFVVRLVLRGHPHLGGLFDDLLADCMYTGVELCDRAGTGRSGLGFELQFLEEVVESLHPLRLLVQLTPSRSMTKMRVRPESWCPPPAGP